MEQNNIKIKMKECDHVQLGGQAYYDERKYFAFAPDDPVPGRVERFRGLGMAERMTDGTFDFVRRPKKRPQSELIKKLAHGRVSKTKDGAIQLTLKVFAGEGLNISQALLSEAGEASEALIDYQLKH